MPLAPVDAKGAHLFYEDSGSPGGSTYTTLVIVHGTSFHSSIFLRLFPYAALHNLRLVLVNRRDYPGSTPFSVEELEKLGSDDRDTQRAFLRDRGLELASFLEWYTKEHTVFPVSRDGKTGGLSLLAWSAGNATALALLGNVEEIPEGTVNALDPYLRSYIVFDAPFRLFGIPPPEGSYDPIRDPDIPLEQKDAAFNYWVSAYYQHPDLDSRSLHGLDLRYLKPNPNSRPTIGMMNPAELTAVADPDVLMRSEAPLRKPTYQAIYAENAEKALFDDETAKIWPNMKVPILWCSQSVWQTVYGAWEAEKLRAKYRAAGVAGRPVQIYKLESMNHFPHWDDPQRCIEAFAEFV